MLKKLPVWTQKIFRNFRKFFFNAEVGLITENGLEVVDIGEPRPLMIVPRYLCLYSLIELENVPSHFLYSVVRNKVLELSPFSETGFSAVKFSSAVGVWYWDASHVKVLLDSDFNGTDLVGFYVAESVVSVNEEISEGEEDLLPVMKGTELRQWKRGVLVDSIFSREPENPLLLNLERFNENRKLWSRLILPGSEFFWRFKTVAAALCSVWLIFIFYELGTIAKLEFSTYQNEKKFAEIVESSAPLLEIRGRALQAESNLGEFHNLLGGYSQDFLMSEVDAILTGEVKIRRWNYSAWQLVLTIEDPNADPLLYVRNFEGSPIFSTVTIEPTRYQNMLDLSMRITPVNSDG